MLVGTSAVSLGVAQSVTPVIQNLGPGNLYLGNSAVATSTGFKITPGSAYEFPRHLSYGVGALWAVADQVNTDVRILQIG